MRPELIEQLGRMYDNKNGNNVNAVQNGTKVKAAKTLKKNISTRKQRDKHGKQKGNHNDTSHVVSIIHQQAKREKSKNKQMKRKRKHGHN